MLIEIFNPERSELENLQALFNAVTSGEVITLREALRSFDKSLIGRLYRARMELAVAKGEIESMTFKGTTYVNRQALRQVASAPL
jgi:hypothetical protein